MKILFQSILHKDYIARSLFFACLFSCVCIYSQANKFSRGSIKTGVALGGNEGAIEGGIGTFSTIGYEKIYGKKERVRVNALLLLGGFTNSFFNTPDRKIFYRTTSWNINANYDYLKYKPVSLFVYGGVFANYTRGLLGDGINEFTQEKYITERFANGYFGFNLGGGIRINPPSNRCAFELKPINLQLGNRDYVTFYMMFGVDIKIKK